MRSAFHFSSECTIMEVTVDIHNFTPTGLPFCSIPSFTQPTMIPRDPQIVLPVVVPPHICNCITFHGEAITGRIKKEISKPQFSMRMSGTKDCCDQDIGLFGQVDIPCMPLHVSATAEIHATFISVPIVDIMLTRYARTDGECQLKFSIDIEVPKYSVPDCMNFSIVHSEAKSTGSFFDYTVDIAQTRELVGSHTECRISFHFSFQFPTSPSLPSCMEFYIVHSEAKSLGSFFDYTVDIAQTRELVGSHTECRISFHFSFQYPSNPLGLLEFNYDVGPCLTMNGNVSCFSAGTCRLSMHIEMNTLRVGALLLHSPSGNSPLKNYPLSFRLRMTKCTMDYDVSLLGRWTCPPCLLGNLIYSGSVRLKGLNWLEDEIRTIAGHDPSWIGYQVFKHQTRGVAHIHPHGITYFRDREIDKFSLSPPASPNVLAHQVMQHVVRQVIEFDRTYGHEHTIYTHTKFWSQAFDIPCQLGGLHVQHNHANPVIKLFTITPSPGRACEYVISLGITIPPPPPIDCDAVCNCVRVGTWLVKSMHDTPPYCIIAHSCPRPTSYSIPRMQLGCTQAGNAYYLQYGVPRLHFDSNCGHIAGMRHSGFVSGQFCVISVPYRHCSDIADCFEHGAGLTMYYTGNKIHIDLV